MKSMEVTMTRQDLKDIPEHSLPEGFYLDFFQEGDEADWVHLETVTDEFPNEEKAWARFNREFGNRLEEFSKRCLFLKNEKDEIIGTTTAWYGKIAGEEMGRIHWVSLLPKYQGQGLAKPILSGAMKVLAQYHDKAYLDSETKNYKAINLYLQYGFKPYFYEETDREAWKILEESLGKKIVQ